MRRPYFSVTTFQPMSRNMASIRAKRRSDDEGVEALAVVVDDPPDVADVVLPAFEQRLEDVAFVELGIAERAQSSARRAGRRPKSLVREIVLHERRKAGQRDAEADRAGGEIDIVGVLRARRIRLRAAEGAEPFELRRGVWRPNRYWMAWKTGLACGFTATRSAGRRTSK